MSNGDMNQVIVEARLGHDPELRYTASGQAVCNLRVASNRFYMDKEGQKQKRTTWTRCVVWGGRAEAVGKHLHKGSRVRILGELQNGSFTNKEGKEVRYDEIRVADIRFLDQAPKAASADGDQMPEEQAPPPSDLIAENSTPEKPAEVDPRDVVF